jgi:hypothetical protein
MWGVESAPGYERWGCAGGSIIAERLHVEGQQWHMTTYFCSKHQDEDNIIP